MRISCCFVAFCMLATSAAHADLVAYINFDGNTLDQSGNGNAVTGSISGFVTGHEGQAGNFDGLDDFLDLNVNISPGVLPEVTIGAWAKTDVFAGLRAILSADDNDPGNFDRQIGLDTRGSGGALTYSAFAGQSQGVLSPGVTLTSDFTFVAARYDGTNVTLFVDGIQITGIDDTDGDLTHTNQLRIGKNPFFDQFFDGAIDNAFVFDEALSDSEINNIRLNGSSAILGGSTAVPEPNLALVIGSALATLALRRRR